MLMMAQLLKTGVHPPLSTHESFPNRIITERVPSYKFRLLTDFSILHANLSGWILGSLDGLEKPLLCVDMIENGIEVLQTMLSVVRDHAVGFIYSPHKSFTTVLEQTSRHKRRQWQ
jgi:hypothetical protein